MALKKRVGDGGKISPLLLSLKEILLWIKGIFSKDD